MSNSADSRSGWVAGLVGALLGAVLGAGATLAATFVQADASGDQAQAAFREDRARDSRDRRETAYGDYVRARAAFEHEAGIAAVAIETANTLKPLPGKTTDDAIASSKEAAGKTAEKFFLLEQAAVAVSLIGSEAATSRAGEEVLAARKLIAAINRANFESGPLNAITGARETMRSASGAFLDQARDDLGTAD